MSIELPEAKILAEQMNKELTGRPENIKGNRKKQNHTMTIARKDASASKLSPLTYGLLERAEHKSQSITD